MSYCRFSSDNWKSDVYVYESVYGGWTTHVAGRRRVFPIIPEFPFSLYPSMGAEWDKAARKVVYPTRWHELAARCVYAVIRVVNLPHRWSLRLTPLRDITLPHAGETFDHDTSGECADWLEELRRTGYHVPQYAINALREEANERKD